MVGGRTDNAVKNRWAAIWKRKGGGPGHASATHAAGASTPAQTRPSRASKHVFHDEDASSTDEADSDDVDLEMEEDEEVAEDTPEPEEEESPVAVSRRRLSPPGRLGNVDAGAAGTSSAAASKEAAAGNRSSRFNLRAPAHHQQLQQQPERQTSTAAASKQPRRRQPRGMSMDLDDHGSAASAHSNDDDSAHGSSPKKRKRRPGPLGREDEQSDLDLKREESATAGPATQARPIRIPQTHAQKGGRGSGSKMAGARAVKVEGEQDSFRERNRGVEEPGDVSEGGPVSLSTRSRSASDSAKYQSLLISPRLPFTPHLVVQAQAHVAGEVGADQGNSNFPVTR